MRSFEVGDLCPTEVYYDGLSSRLAADEMMEERGSLLVLTSRMRKGEVGLGAAVNYAIIRDVQPTEQPDVLDVSMMVASGDAFVDLRAYFVDGLWQNPGVVRLHGARPVSGYLSGLGVEVEQAPSGLLTTV